ncbi:MAG: acetylglutamate kinase [Candidatus Lambdaproteobacteria bacterium]|nr:acetylglutamate kinase [Candidatus Lambdaproteobacteria bacterium]
MSDPISAATSARTPNGNLAYREKKNLLIEALSYIGKFKGATIVVKYGGAAMVREDIKVSFTHDMVLLQSLGMRPVIVHGGGPEVSKAMQTMGQKPEFVEGLRVTDKESLRITEMVLSGTINKEIVANINIQGGKGVGVSGKDAMTLQARKMLHVKGIDLGYVGEIVKVEPGLINLLLDHQYLPVISPIGIGDDGQTYNINADTAASRIAAALDAEKVIFMTDVPGIVNEGKLVSTLTTKDTKQLIDTGVIQGGMLPKVEAMLYALANGVRSAHIIGGMDHHAVIAELFTDKGTGTIITH